MGHDEEITATRFAKCDPPPLTYRVFIIRNGNLIPIRKYGECLLE